MIISYTTKKTKKDVYKLLWSPKRASVHIILSYVVFTQYERILSTTRNILLEKCILTDMLKLHSAMFKSISRPVIFIELQIHLVHHLNNFLNNLLENAKKQTVQSRN